MFIIRLMVGLPHWFRWGHHLNPIERIVITIVAIFILTANFYANLEDTAAQALVPLL